MFRINCFSLLTVCKQKTVLMLTDLFEIELFWHLTVCKQSCTYTKLHFLKVLSKWLNSALNNPKKWWYAIKPTNQPTNQECGGIQDMTHNIIQWVSSRSWDMGNVMSPLHCHYSQTHSDPVRVPSMGQIDLYANYIYFIRILDII